jgi:hypothetical protein
MAGEGPAHAQPVGTLLIRAAPNKPHGQACLFLLNFGRENPYA